MLTKIKILYEVNRNAYKTYIGKRKYAKAYKGDWANLPDQVFKNAPCCFVLSTGRCGTKLLTNLYEATKGISVFHTPEPELVYASKLAYIEGEKHFNCYKIAMICSRYKLVESCYIRKQIYIETNNHITFFARHVSEVFGKSKFIHLVRHPGEFVRAGIRRGYYIGHSYDVGRITPVNGDERQAWKSMSQIEKITWLWNETNKFIENFKQKVDTSRIFFARSEDLFKDPNVYLNIASFIGCDPPSEKKIQKIIGKPVNVQKEGEFPTYSQWTEDKKDQLRRFALLADVYGYVL